MNDEKTFSQSEVNAIVSERLKQERSRLMADVNRREAELTRREALLTAKADWQKRGLPADLLDYVNNIDALDDIAGLLEGFHNSCNTPKGTRGGFAGASEPIKEADPDAALRSAMGLNRKAE